MEKFGFDTSKFYKEARKHFGNIKLTAEEQAEILKKEQERERTLSEKYAGYDDASDAKKKRIENRDKRRKERYAESEKRTDAKRERYAEKMAMKGIVGSKQEARARFDTLRGITKSSAIEKERLNDLSTANTKKFTVDARDLTEEEENEINDQSTQFAISTIPTSGSTSDLGSFDYTV